MIEKFDDFKFWYNQLISNSKEIESYVEEAKNTDRLTGSKHIISILRNTVEAAINCIAIKDGCEYSDSSTHKSVNKQSILFVQKNRSKYEELCLLHDLINNSSGHESCFVGDYAERMMLHYLPKMIKVKKYFEDRYKIAIFNNLNQFPLKIENSLKEYYSKIVETIKNSDSYGKLLITENYYILDKKEKYIDGFSFFEYTLSIIDDNSDKADKLIAFSTTDIYSKYAMKIKSYDEPIHVLGINTTVKIITDYDIVIRNCEFEKLGQILGVESKNFSKTNEYYSLMSFIKNKRINLAELVKMDRARFDKIYGAIFNNKIKPTILSNIIKSAWINYHKHQKGRNVLLYLLASMENNLLYRQIYDERYKRMPYTDMFLTSKAIPFDETPFCAGLFKCSVDSDILFSTFNVLDHEFELVKREIDIYCQTNGLIYCPLSLFEGDNLIFDKIRRLNTLKNNYKPFCINIFYDKNNIGYLYIEQNEDDINELFSIIFDYIKRESIVDYSNFSEAQIHNKNILIDDELKRRTLVKMYEGRSLFAVYGPAGTGKSYLSKLVLDVLDNYRVLCISSTHASLQNIKRRIGANRAKYITVEKASKSSVDSLKNYNLIIFDECSTISNSDMLNILKRISPELILLLGDVYQIQSIDLGNWFGLLEKFIPNDATVFLDKCHRTNKNVLSDFWKIVRDIDPNIHQYMKNYEISHELSQEFFKNSYDDDEIVLCLNYGGLYGINNINKLMQCKNEGDSVIIRDHLYKIGDPILFKDIRYYEGIFYNNLKGTIKDLKEYNDRIEFTVLVKDNLNISIGEKKVANVRHMGGETQLTFAVYKSNDLDIDSDIVPSKIVPFNIAYAVSIHKAQGLEFKKVNIIISSEVKEMVTHNIFYTATTRAVEELNVFWSPECESSVVDNLKTLNYTCDESILLKKFEWLRKYKN